MRIPAKASFSGRLWLDSDGRRLLGKGRVQLLTLIDRLGSIRSAAGAMGMSYKAAWESVERMNRLADEPLVVSTRGGAGGGETRLTDYGKAMVRLYQAAEVQHRRFLAGLTARLGEDESLEALLEHLESRE